MNAKELITKDLSHVDVPRIKEYVANKVDTDNSSAVDKAVEEFLDNFNQWKDIVGFNIGLGEDSEWLYGSAFRDIFCLPLFFFVSEGGFSQALTA